MCYGLKDVVAILSYLSRCWLVGKGVGCKTRYSLLTYSEMINKGGVIA
jgi:hypothetical protein